MHRFNCEHVLLIASVVSGSRLAEARIYQRSADNGPGPGGSAGRGFA